MKEEKKRILGLVEQGKLSVEEALFLIEELEKKEQSMEEKKEAMITELSTSVKSDGAAFNEQSKKEESPMSKLQFAMDNLVGFVDTAFKKIKDVDLDFNFGQSVEITHIFQQATSSVKQIDIDIANGSFRIAPWDQDEIRIECSAKVYRAENQDAARKKFLDETIFIADGEKLRFSIQQKWIKADVVAYVPRAEYETARMRLFNGPVTVDGLSVKDVKAKTANGQVELAGMVAKKAEAETANGQIHIHDSHIYELEAETINGLLKVEGSFNQADLQTFSGGITCKVKNQDCELVEAKSATGAIDLMVPAEMAASGELKSNLGHFKLGLENVNVIEEKSEMVQKSLSFRPKSESYNPCKVFADSKTGAISLKQIQ